MSHRLASYILITGIEKRKHAIILSTSRWRMTVFLLCTKETSAIGEFNMHEKLFWSGFSINADDTHVISTQNIWTSRQRSHIQGDRKSIRAEFPGWSITIRKWYEYCLETDTRSRVRGEYFLWDSVLPAHSPDPSKVFLQSTLFPLLPLTFWVYYTSAIVLSSYEYLMKRVTGLMNIHWKKIRTADTEIKTFF